MNLKEKISYIKGLTEGLSLDESKPETKVINAIIDFLDEVALSVSEMEELYDELSEQVDEIDQDLAEVEDDIYDEWGDYDEDEEDPFYEVTCSSCGHKINVAEDVLLEGEIECPECGEVIEFDFSELYDEDFDDEDFADDDASDSDAPEEKE